MALLRNNASSKLEIALKPNEANLQSKDFKKVCLSEEFIHNITFDKVDKKYFCNEGVATSFVIGKSESISVSIDIDLTDEAHKYLYDLFCEANFTTLNNQYIRLTEPIFAGQNTASYIHGTAAIQFKNGIPSGAVDEVVKLTFDIVPTSPWEREKGTYA